MEGKSLEVYSGQRYYLWFKRSPGYERILTVAWPDLTPFAVLWLSLSVEGRMLG